MTMRFALPVAVVTLLVSVPPALASQGPRQPGFERVRDPVLPADHAVGRAGRDRRCGVASAPSLAVGAIAGGAVGLVAGAFGLGALAGQDEYEALGMAVVGGVVGEVAGVAIGAHLANESRGDLFATFVGSGVGLLVAAFASAQVDDAHHWIVVPLIQVPITVAVEHHSGREKARKLAACRPI